MIEYFVNQNKWENHEARPIQGDYPQMYLLVGKKSDAYELLVNPVIDGIRNQDTCPLPLNVIKLDSSKGIEVLKSQIIINRPVLERLNLYVIEDFDESIYQGREIEEEFSRLLCSLMGTLQYIPHMTNSHIIIISDKTPGSCLDYFFRKNVLTQIVL